MTVALFYVMRLTSPPGLRPLYKITYSMLRFLRISSIYRILEVSNLHILLAIA
jgi:hypothetical protein